MAHMNSHSYDNLRRISRVKFTLQKFLKLKELVKNTIGEDNEIFVSQLNSLMALYKQAAQEVESLETQILSLIKEVSPKSLTIPGIGALSAAVIYAEYGDLSKFDSPSQMLSFAGLEPGYYQSGTSEHGGHMVKRGSSHLRFTLMNLCIPLTQYNMIFAEYYVKKRAPKEKLIVWHVLTL